MLDLVKLLHYKRVGLLHLTQITILPEEEQDRNAFQLTEVTVILLPLRKTGLS
jgi:hypothetical protein